MIVWDFLLYRSPVQSKVWSMSARASGTVNATVEIIFKKGAEIKETDVLKQMKAAVDCADCLLKGAQFKSKFVNYILFEVWIGSK